MSQKVSLKKFRYFTKFLISKFSDLLINLSILNSQIRMSSETPSSKGFVPKIVGGTEFKGEEFSLGDLVMHDVFGEGTILNYEGEGANARVEVNFTKEGIKWLVLSFANLKKV